MRPGGRERTEAGFTLIELTVAVSIMTVVMAALSGTFIALLELAPTTGSRYSESHDAQLAATYWPTDVQSAESFSTTDASCHEPDAATTPLVSFQWTSPDGVTKVAAYQQRAGAGRSPGGDVVRTLCLAPAGGGPVTRTSTVIAHGVQPPGVVWVCQRPSCNLTVTEASGYRFSVGGTMRVGL